MSQNTTAMQRGASGETTGATDMTTQQTDALQCAADLEYSIARHGMQDAFTLNAYRAMKMVRTQLARITELESQLAQRFDEADMATAAAQGFRDGVASVSAGSAPVAWKHDCAALLANDVELWIDACPHCGKPRMHATQAAHPSPPEGMAGWTTLPGQMPEPNTPVLLDIGKKFTIRALWAEKHTVRVGTDVDDWGEYDEETDEYYCPEGWYEWNEHEEVHWAVSETPRAWRELPQPIPAAPGPADGESND